ncbi:ARM repeat-containing protein [Haematococcus lacustris]|uniref:ARM repeat-containing protein n=1 Tax=Haematococcus lacustris TaxID=44745 RepID=A0A699YTX0_HAELA|nr:ARM repeat-containing protein [Haematococcus lacustris]
MQVNGGAGGGRLLSGAEASREVLGQLAAELVRVVRKGEAGGLAAQAAVHALAAVGCLLPEVVGGVASQLVGFVTDVLLPAPQLHLWPTQEGTEAGVAAGDEETSSNPLLLAKAAALRAVARGLTPSVEAGPMPAATVEAVKQLGQVLERLLDVDAEQEVPGCSGEEERGMLRLAAARAVLKLSTRHDSALPPSCYVATALMLQDPVPEPRAVFGAKLRKHVSRLLTMGLVASHAGAPRGGGWLPSKYAAMLALSGVTDAAVDPVELNKASAARGLREFVVAKRIAANAAAQAAALQPEPLAGTRRKGAAGNGGNIQEQPEFMLPHLLYLLALHPDCPDQDAVCGSQQQDSAGEAGAGDEAQALLAPFVAMLQALLEPLLLAAHAGGSGHTQAAALLPTLKRVLQSTKVTCLADEDSTAKMRLMCDLGSAVAAAIVTRENTGSPPPAAPPSQVAVVLPRSLFIMDHLAHAPKGVLGVEAVAGWH